MDPSLFSCTRQQPGRVDQQSTNRYTLRLLRSNPFNGHGNPRQWSAYSPQSFTLTGAHPAESRGGAEMVRAGKL